MKIGEIKAEALRLMFTGVGDAGAEEIPALLTEAAYADYLGSMTGVINRCLADLERRMAGALLRRETTASAWRQTAFTSRLRLAELENFYALLFVSVEDERGYVGNPPHALEGDELVLSRLSEDARVTVVYVQSIGRVEEGEDDGVIAGLSEGLASLIPYFIKSELYCEEEPAEAEAARARYEAGVERYLAARDLGGQTAGACVRVQSVYSQEGM